MATTEARAMIGGAFKDLQTFWGITKGEWRDAQAQRFEDQFLHPLALDVKSAVTAIEQLGKSLAQARRDCE